MQFLTSVASQRLVLVGCAHPTNSSPPETEVDLQSEDVGRGSGWTWKCYVCPFGRTGFHRLHFFGLNS